ncbi:MAG TPA: anti-sigma factor [Acidimicrobiales bacterium]|jgi:anti-sigma-K factor RskA|nr:anti-sigma factor [Acidimicrobiales bacterium]
MSHDDASELLAPLALDALDPDIAANVEAHVHTCAECRAELDGLREVASALGTSLEAPPDDLWDKIASRLYEGERGDVAELPPLLTEYARPDDRRSRGVRRRTRIVVSATLLAAAAAILALALNLSSESGRVSNLQRALGSGVVHQALVTPGHRLVRLRGSDDTVLATFVVLPNGTGYLVNSAMPRLPASETYQLWGIVAGRPVSIGIMGSSPHEVVFTLASSPGPSKLAVTVEPAVGASTPTSPMIATGVV